MTSLGVPEVLGPSGTPLRSALPGLRLLPPACDGAPARLLLTAVVLVRLHVAPGPMPRSGLRAGHGVGARTDLLGLTSQSTKLWDF